MTDCTGVWIQRDPERKTKCIIYIYVYISVQKIVVYTGYHWYRVYLFKPVTLQAQQILFITTIKLVLCNLCLINGG
jgi:hypothetical protein